MSLPLRLGLSAVVAALGFASSAVAATPADQVAERYGLDVQHTTPLPSGATSVILADEQQGIPLFGSDVRVAVAANGRVLASAGAPTADVQAPTLTPAVSAPAALAAARADAGLPDTAPAATELGGARDRWRFADGSAAALVRYPTADGAATIAWRLLLDDRARSGGLWDVVVDGRDGAVLLRSSLVSEASTASVFPAWPGATVGGTQVDEDFTPWLTSTTALEGNNAHAWADVDGDGSAQPSEEIAPSSGTDYRYPFTPVSSGGACLPIGCSWDETTPGSWETNKRQDATQIFSLTNRMHDWLEQPAIGFDEAAGNFQTVNTTGEGWDLDAVQVHTSFGADTESGLPSTAYRNNANMSTPPDGYSPDMRMYVWGFVFPDVFGSADGVIVLHEYTHGLSNRLVIDGDGYSTLSQRESRAMGEGWSDWYAQDYLVAHGAQTDDPAIAGDVRGGPLNTDPRVRTQPIDCPVGTAAAACPGSATAGPGGYTYADYGTVRARGPQPHDDGEIWGETLWDLRQAVGAPRARTLITRGMQLSAPYPSFLDMRNAILQADTTFFAGADLDAIWSVFAGRGMGWFASAQNGDDVTPIADTSTRPLTSGTLSGRVTLDGAPVDGARVRVDAGLATTTDPDGRYALTLPSGTYARVYVTPTDASPVASRDVAVPAAGSRTLDVELGQTPAIPVYPTPAPVTVSDPPAPVTPPAPDPPAAAPTPTPAAPPAPAAPTGVLSPSARTSLENVLRRGLPLRLSCATACQARVVVRVDGQVVGVTSRSLRAGRPTTLRVALRPRARARLADRTRVRASVTVQLRGPGAGVRTLRRSVVVRAQHY